MDIVIIGSGNVAAILGRKFIAAGHKIIQIISRKASAASELAYVWDTESANYMSLVNKNADVYIIAVSDNALEEVVSDLKLPGKVVAHTAGSVSKDILKNITSHYGVFTLCKVCEKKLSNCRIYRYSLKEAIRRQPPGFKNWLKPFHLKRPLQREQKNE